MKITPLTTLKLIRYLSWHVKKGADDDRDDHITSSCGTGVADRDQLSPPVTLIIGFQVNLILHHQTEILGLTLEEQVQST